MSSISHDMEGGAGVPEFRYDESSGSYYMKPVGEDQWLSLRETQLRRELKSAPHLLRDKPMAMNGETISPLDARIREIEQRARVKFACVLAGWRSGVHEMGADAVLVTRSPKLIVPKKGEWPLLAKVLEGIFCGSDIGDDEKPVPMDQRDRWLAWEQHWLRALYAGVPAKGLWLCIAGEPNCGKTLLGDIMKALAGGNEGKPYKWLIDEEEFNSELFEASLQTIDDENANTKIVARKELGAKAKQIVKVGDMRMRGMHRNGVVLEPCWRLVSLLNIEAESLLVMPPISNDIADAILMLKGYQRPRPGAGASDYDRRCWPMPMPADTPAEQAAFWAALKAELPAFVFWLLEEYVAPSHVAGGRRGVLAWQHPEILRELQHFSPHVRLWNLIERSEVVFRKRVAGAENGEAWEPCDEWIGSASALEQLLKSEASKLARSDKDREIKDSSWLGQHLKAAQAQWGKAVVDFKRTTIGGVNGRFYVLHRRPDLIE